MKAYVFPGQGSQFEGMGSDIYSTDPAAKSVFDLADKILEFPLSEVMFEGSSEDLKQTKVTQPALFVHSMAKVASIKDNFKPNAVAGHSLGEFSALAASGALDFEKALLLVHERAMAMQYACDIAEGTMAAILGLDDEVVEKACGDIDDIVVAANYNCPGQLVISGSINGINKAVEEMKDLGARRALVLPVGGAFHSPLMAPAEERLAKAITETQFSSPVCPVYQNFDAKPHTDPEEIKENLIKQLTGPVRWTQSIQNMANDGISDFAECGGSGKVLMGLIRKINRELNVESV